MAPSAAFGRGRAGCCGILTRLGGPGKGEGFGFGENSMNDTNNKAISFERGGALKT